MSAAPRQRSGTSSCTDAKGGIIADGDTSSRGRPFAGRFFEWTPDSRPGVVVPATDEAWGELGLLYAPDEPSPPLQRVFDVARGHGTRTIVVERRYIDADWRSSHERFYAGTYRRYPSVCHRLHFFSGEFRRLAEIGDHTETYIGFSVIRPLEWSPVGRTLLKPPSTLADATLCLAMGRARLFGWDLTVEAMPFISQDQQFLRCAHAVQWMVLHHTYLRRGGRRALPGDIQRASAEGRRTNRLIPSMGLNTDQILFGLDSLGLSGAAIDVDFRDRKESKAQRHTSLFAILSRYVNSQIPPIVLSNRHAWVVAGYTAAGERGHDDIRLVCHDDAKGPYLIVEDPWEDTSIDRRWRVAVVPYPTKVYVTGEKAEEIGRHWFSTWLRGSGGENRLAEAVEAEAVHYRTYAIDSSDFKAGLRQRAVHSLLRDMYCYTQWPRYVWVVEALDNRLRGNHGPEEGAPVLGEVVLDATSHHLAKPEHFRPLAVHVCGDLVIASPDHDQDDVTVQIQDFAPYSSGCTRDLLHLPE